MDLDLLIGIAGVVVTVLVVAGMILITPSGVTTRPRPAAGDEDVEGDEREEREGPPATTARPSLPTVP